MAGDPSDYMPPELEQLADRMDNVRVLRPTSSAEGKPVQVFEFEMLADMDEDEDLSPVWAVEDFLETDTTALFFGDPESGKSFGALSLGLSMASGVSWFGRPVKRGPVLYIAGEGRRGLKRRIRAWCIENGVAQNTLCFGLSKTATSLTDEIARAELVAVLAKFKAERGAPVLVVIDTLARNFGPGDENTSQDMGQAVGTLDALRDVCEGAVMLVVHHSGHADKGRARGSSSLKGALDCEYQFSRDPDRLVRVESMKQKDNPHPAPMLFALHSVDLGKKDPKGRPVTSAVLRAVDNPQASAPARPAGNKSAGKGQNQQRAMACLWVCIDEQRRRLIEAGLNPSNVRVTVDDWRDRCAEKGIDRKRWPEVLKALRDLDRVRIVGVYVHPIEEE